MGGVGLGIVAVGYGLKTLWDNAGKDEADAIDAGADVQVASANNQKQTYQDATQDAQAGLDPYAQQGTDAVAQQRALSGLDGPEAQQAALQQIQGGGQYQAQLQAGNQNILANASATGGLRGGNTQAALAQFAPQLLNQLVEQQLNRLGGFAGAGQNAAAQQGAVGMQGAAGVADAQGQAGAARAGGIIGQQMAQTQARNTMINQGLSVVGGVAQLAAGMPPTAFANAAPSQAAPPQQQPMMAAPAPEPPTDPILLQGGL